MTLTSRAKVAGPDRGLRGQQGDIVALRHRLLREPEAEVAVEEPVHDL
jgi:hypothetical protein